MKSPEAIALVVTIAFLATLAYAVPRFCELVVRKLWQRRRKT